MNQIDVLNLEWTSYPSRDRETATLVCNYLRYMGLNVVEGPVHNGFELLKRYKPRLFFITNSIGATINFQIMKYAKSLGIWCVSSVSEGNFRQDIIDQFTWGHNTDRYLYEDRWLLWTERTRELVLQRNPNLSSRVRVAGGAGFDRFKILRHEKNWFDSYKDRDTELVVGLGCWDFGFIDSRDTRNEKLKKLLTRKELEFFKLDRAHFNWEICKLVRDNPRITFLIKEHPGGQRGRWGAGIETIEQYKNVRIFKNEVSVFQCLSAADIWISYESTTAIEGWMMGKETGLLNPSGTDFPLRANVHQGQPNYPDAEAWSDAVQEYRKTGELPGFSDLKAERDKIFKRVIQWDDGLNHVRVGNAIIDLIESEQTPQSFPDSPGIKKIPWKRRINQKKMWRLSPYLKTLAAYKAFYTAYRSSWNDLQLKQFSENRMQQQTSYYRTKGFSKAMLRRIAAI